MQLKMPANNQLCPICKTKKKATSEKYCNNHNLAKIELQSAYESWLKAYGVLSWDDFLQRLLNLADIVGTLIKDVAEYEMYFK